MWQLVIGVWQCLAIDVSMTFLWYRDSSFYKSCHNIMVLFCQHHLWDGPFSSHLKTYTYHMNSGNMHDDIPVWLYQHFNPGSSMSVTYTSPMFFKIKSAGHPFWILLVHRGWLQTTLFFLHYHNLKISPSAMQAFASTVICRNIHLSSACTIQRAVNLHKSLNLPCVSLHTTCVM
jgi:hypothetical protein